MFYSALNNNQLALAEEVLKFSNAKDMEVLLILDCFILALSNNQPDLAKKVIDFYKAKDIDANYIKNRFEVVLEKDNIKDETKFEIIDQLLNLPKAKNIDGYNIQNLFELVLKKSNIEDSIRSKLSYRLLELPHIKQAPSNLLKSMCDTIINIEKLHPELLEKILDHDKLKFDIEFLSELKTKAEGKGKKEIVDTVQSFIVKAVARSEKKAIDIALNSQNDLPVKRELINNVKKINQI